MTINKEFLKKNVIIVSTTLPNNKTSKKRKNNLINKFYKNNIPIFFNKGIQNNPKIVTSYICLKRNIEAFIRSKYEYGIICDDDFYPIDNFFDEIKKTVDLLPNNWRTLYLCPGYLWGRKFRDNSKIGKLNPEYKMDGIPYHSSGRFYNNCSNEIYQKKKFWLGGPVSFLVNKKNAISLLKDYVKQYYNDPKPNDVTLTQILNKNDFICREPILGYENEEGGTTF